MGDSFILNFDLSKLNGINRKSKKERSQINKIVKFFMRDKVSHYGRYGLTKFSNFLYICIAFENCVQHFGQIWYEIPAHNASVYCSRKLARILQAYYNVQFHSF